MSTSNTINLLSLRWEKLGFVSCRKCDNGYLTKKDSIKECECLKTFKANISIKGLLRKSGIEESFSYSLSSYIGDDKEQNIKKIKSFIKDFDTKFKGVSLYFWSKKNSTQKTTLSKVIAKELLKKGFKVQFVIMNDLMKDLMSEQFEEDLDEKIRKYYDCDLLIIDDSFDPKKVTLYKSKYQLSFLDSFLRKRMEQLKKSILFTSNISLEEIEKSFEISIAKLVERNCAPPLLFNDEPIQKTNIQEIWG